MKENQVERASRIASLIVKRMQESLSEAEQAELEAWLREDSENYLLLEEMMDVNNLNQQLAELQSIDHEQAYERFTARVFPPAAPVKKPLRKIWYFAAAAILLFIFSFRYLMNDPAPPAPALTANEFSDISPGGKKATLTLANGATVDLDQQETGIVAREGNSVVQLGDSGKLSYRSASGPSDKSTQLMHTLSVPRGGEYEITLGDGTKIWLNAVSVLQFPVDFSGRERRVRLVGEAYFQVAKNGAPFIVEVNGTEVQALGTEFNINAYPEKKSLQTALVSGSVKITKGELSQLLQPGTLATIDSTGAITVRAADIEEVTAWKKGAFIFRNTPLSAILEQLTRWYDVEISNPSDLPNMNFTGSFRRDHGIKNILGMIELTGDLRFEVEGRAIKVLPPLPESSL
jgi:transmembrane sensor